MRHDTPYYSSVSFLSGTCLALILVLGLSASTAGKAAGRSELSGPTQQTGELEEADRLTQQAKELFDKGQFDAAIPLIERALAIRERVLGPEHPDVANSLNNLAGLYDSKGDKGRAEPLFRRALAIRERALGPEHPATVTSLNNLAALYIDTGDYARAEPLHQRALAAQEKRFGPEHPNVARSLKNLGIVYLAQGDYARAEPLFRRSLAIYEKSVQAGHPVLAEPVYYLAELYRAKGDYLQSEPLHQRALSIRENALGPDHPQVAGSLYSIAVLYKDRGDYARAEPLYQRALAISEKALGPGHPTVATYLLSYGTLYESKDDLAQAEKLYQRALAIHEQTLGAEHPTTATSLNNLANLYERQGDYLRAEPLMRRALAIREKTLGPDHPDVSQSLNNLASLSEGRGDYVKAEQLFRRSLAIDERALGAKHPSRAATMNNLALMYGEKGDAAQAVQLLTRGNDIREYNLALILTTGSEAQKRLYLETLLGETYATVSLHVRSAPRDPQAARLALTTILRRKGRVLDAMSDRISVLRRRLNPEDRALLDQLSETSSRLAALTLKGPGQTDPAAHQRAVAALEAEVERLNAQVTSRSDLFRAQSRPVTLEAIQQAIPPGVALIEFVCYRPYNGRVQRRDQRFGPFRYVAYVVRREGDPLWVDLGDGDSVNLDIARLYMALKNPASTNLKQLARALDERVMRPVRQLLGETRQIFISPDYLLGAIPFGALVDEQGRYLVENYSITYLTSGRDLLRLQVKGASRSAPVVIANPLFGGSGAPPAQTGSRSVALSNVTFNPLPGTAGEAAALKTVLSGAKVLTGAQATETAVKQLNGPSILHIATHGFVLPDQPQAQGAAGSRGLVLNSDGATAGAAVTPVRENPLLRSGLALAGVNQRQGGAGEDGVLTALEAAALDLWGTKLVVLSACETGLGILDNLEGIYGLKRALVLAGAETQLISLWQVSDEATRDLMVAYYKRLEAGEGRSEALRTVQLEMLGARARSMADDRRGLSTESSGMTHDWSHPFFWSSFIASGDWRNLEGKGAGDR